MMHRYQINVVGNAPYNYPTETLFGLLFCRNGEVIEIPQNYPFEGEWGNVLETSIVNNDGFQIPSKLEIIWLSLVEKKFYEVIAELPFEELESLWKAYNPYTKEPLYDTMIIGMCPCGYIAIWFHGQLKSELVGWYKATETTVPMSQFIPNHPELSIEEYCSKYLRSLHLSDVTDIHLPYFPKRMNKYMYRYILYFEKWDNNNCTWEKLLTEDVHPEFDYIDEKLYDGTHDKLHDERNMKYHEAGKPYKLAIKWHLDKNEYKACIWFEEEQLCELFEHFYGAHPKTNSDFIIRIDEINKKIEFSLYRYGIKMPLVISDNVYQFIVFKNNFEEFRSDNYTQNRSAWNW